MIDMINLLEFDNCAAVSNSSVSGLKQRYLRPSVRLSMQTLAHCHSRHGYSSIAQATHGQMYLSNLLAIMPLFPTICPSRCAWRFCTIHTRSKRPNEVEVFNAQTSRAKSKPPFLRCLHYFCRGQGALRATEVSHDLSLMLLTLRFDT
jgi:hypothetical protein